jgi:dGTP triphosphohydrolase
MSSIELLSKLQISAIETNKLFRRLSEKTQVAFPRQGMPEVLLTRLTHSFEVATSSAVMAYFIADQFGWAPRAVDYMGSVEPCSLLHDIGHTPYGHPGKDVLSQRFTSVGLDEGFCDNNNVLTVIEKNNIMVSDHTIASVIKYPSDLYPYQMEKYTALLQKELARDAAHFASLGLHLLPQTRTIACQIMDEADRNTYVCSDLADFLCLGNTLSSNTLKQMADKAGLVYRYSELQALASVMRSRDKSTIKAYFNNLKNQFNMNFTLTEKGLTVLNASLHAYREFLWDVEHEHYIKPIRQEDFHLNNMKKFHAFIDKVLNEGFAPSRTYAAAIQRAKDAGDRTSMLRAQRDMIAEATDLYVTNMPL